VLLLYPSVSVFNYSSQRRAWGELFCVLESTLFLVASSYGIANLFEINGSEVVDGGRAVVGKEV